MRVCPEHHVNWVLSASSSLQTHFTRLFSGLGVLSGGGCLSQGLCLLLSVISPLLKLQSKIGPEVATRYLVELVTLESDHRLGV